MEHKIKIGLVEDQVMFREGLKAIIATWNEMEVIFESGDGFSVTDKLKRMERLPDVLLVDLSLPPNGDVAFSGKEVTDSVLEHFPDIKIIILSVHDDENFIAQLIEHGAHGYLVKDSDPQEVREAILSVHLKGSYINKRTLNAIQNKLGSKIKNAPSPPPVLLTKRECEVLYYICQQMTAEEIAQKLFLSVKTVNNHRNNLLVKTGARNTAGLVIYAIGKKLVQLPN